jgi:hypothetical protein
VLANPDKAAGLASLSKASLSVTVSLPKVPAAHRSAAHHGGSDGTNATDNLVLDLSDDSNGTKTLGMDQVYAVYSTHSSELGTCLQTNAAHAAMVGISIDGPSGRVNSMKVNEQTSGALYNCISTTMLGLQFPTINGPQTRAEFDVSL